MIWDYRIAQMEESQSQPQSIVKIISNADKTPDPHKTARYTTASATTTKQHRGPSTVHDTVEAIRKAAPWNAIAFNLAPRTPTPYSQLWHSDLD